MSRHRWGISLSNDSDARSARSARSAGSSNGSASSHGSFDSGLIEHFSGTDSTSGPSLPGSISSFNPPPRKPAGWFYRIRSKVPRSLVKRRAKNLLLKLIKADDGKDVPTARRERRESAIGLIKIAEGQHDGEEIVARRFVKTHIRRMEGTRALLKLSDDELDEVGYNGTADLVSTKPASIRLLDMVMKHTSETLIFGETISRLLKDKDEGAPAILYLATSYYSLSFLIDFRLIFNFCKRVVTKEVSICPERYCGAKLFCILLADRPLRMRRELGVPELLSLIFKALIQRMAIPLNPKLPEGSGTDFAVHARSLLPMIAVCCDYIGSQGHWSALPSTDVLNTFIERLVTLAHQGTIGRLHPEPERGYALATLLALLESPSIDSSTPENTLSKLGALLIETALYPWVLKQPKRDIFSKGIFKALTSNLDQRCIVGLNRLPESTSTDALASALNKGILQLDLPDTAANPYEPLGLVERLLWLSNLKLPSNNQARIRRALVKGNACGFLNRVLSHTGGLSPEDRGLWRAKGLAMTCLGNIIEGMDNEQVRDQIGKEMIDAVVAIKEHGDTPVLQKGQAILFLKRYTWAADYWGIKPYVREDTSDLPHEFRIVGGQPVVAEGRILAHAPTLDVHGRWPLADFPENLETGSSPGRWGRSGSGKERASEDTGSHKHLGTNIGNYGTDREGRV